MRSYLVPLALLFIAFGVPSTAQSDGGEGGEGAEGGVRVEEAALDAQVYWYNLTQAGAIRLQCGAPPDGAELAFQWLKNGSVLATGPETRFDTADKGATLVLRARAAEDDFGPYECRAGGRPLRAWDVRTRYVAKVAKDTTVVERLTLNVTCRVFGKPTPAVQWWYAPAADANASLVVAGGRVKLGATLAGVADGELLVEQATAADAGVYTCVPQAEGVNVTTDATTVRVKGMYDALWPFLGILAEVFVLCAIILLYEKRRTKTELDDSDTDNHDQKKS